MLPCSGVSEGRIPHQGGLLPVLVLVAVVDEIGHQFVCGRQGDRPHLLCAEFVAIELLKGLIDTLDSLRIDGYLHIDRDLARRSDGDSRGGGSHTEIDWLVRIGYRLSWGRK